MVEQIEILLVEDSPSDAKLMEKMLQIAKVTNKIHLVRDGLAALDYLYQRGPYSGASRPDLIFLDLNLPKKNGIEVLKIIKADEVLRLIPVIIMTSSSDEQDVIQSYANYANSYVTKPVDFEQFRKVVQVIDTFWFSVVKLPYRPEDV